MKSIKHIFSLVLMASLAWACYREPNFDFKPEIEYKSITKIVVTDNFSGAKKDSVVISIGFKDGDGDLGLATSQIESEFKGKYNYLVKAFRQNRGVFSEVKFDPSLSGYYPRLKLNDKIGPLEGTLDYSIDFLQPFTRRNDTLKFQISIKDRADNESNTVETRPVVLNSIIQQ